MRPGPDRDQIKTLVKTLFKHATPGRWISLRAFYEGRADLPPFKITPIKLNGNFETIIDQAYWHAELAAVVTDKVVFCPPIATFINNSSAREENLAEGLVLSVECDAHAQAARKKLEELLGQATMAVESGGMWTDPETGKPEPKLHLYWLLKVPARTKDEHKTLKQARKFAATIVGGDPSNVPLVHPIRWPGSLHRKGEPKLCQIIACNPDAEIDLDAALEILQAAAGNDRQRDETGSGYGFRFIAHCHVEGIEKYEEARDKILKDDGPAGEWARRVDERQLERAWERSKPPEIPLGDAPPYSEEALALAFAERHANTLRYVAEWGQWFMWDGTCWRMDRTRRVFTLARELCRETAAKPNKPSERKRIASAKTRAAVVSLASEDRRLVATTEQWDADPWLLNTPDGVVDLHTGRLREHQATDYMTKQTATSPRGECSRWMSFLQEITAGDDALQSYLQRVSGYSLTGVTTEQQLFFFYGSGNNGKGVWTLTVSGLLQDYHRATSIETFTVARSERHPTELAGLRGARLVTAAETEEGRRWAEARIKEMTGGDKISARFMRQDFFEYFPQFKLLLLGNHMPTLRTVNKAITRRFNRIPFAVTIPDERVNKNLADELKAEWPGILAWAVKGCLEWQRIGLCPPKAVTDATESYLESEDVIGEWLNECCIRDPNAWESSTALFNSWKGWAVGREEWIGSVKTFSAKLEDRGEFKKRRNPEKTRHGFTGLRLNATAEKGVAEKWAAEKGAAEDQAKIANLFS